MLTRTNKITCDDCGRFISIDDLISGSASHVYALPDSEFSRETFESECPRCKKSVSALPSDE